MTDKMVPHLNHEVMEVIFSHIDGKSLARCEQVCKLWKEVVQSLSKQTHIWRTCCEKEIDVDVRIELLNSCYPRWHIMCPSNSDWRVVYKTWCEWHSVGKWSFITNAMDGDSYLNAVMCVKISGRYIISGHTDGGVYLWNSNNFVRVASHMTAVIDLGMMVYNGECRNDSPEMKHDLLISASHDPTIQINHPLGFKHRNLCGFPVVVEEDCMALIALRTFGNMFASLSCSGRVSIWQLNASACNKRVPEAIKLHTLRVVFPSLQAVTIWGNKTIQVSAVANNGLCMPIFGGGDSCSYKLLQDEAQQRFSSPDVWEEIRHSGILKVFLWRYGVSIVLTDQHFMYTSVNGCRPVKYNTMPNLNSYPTTVLLHGEILLLGMECGTLYMYLLSHITDLLTLNLAQVYWKHSVDQDPIIALDIAETSDGPVIAATTHCTIHRILFIPPRLC